MKLIARTKLDNGEIAYASDPQKLYEVKEKLYRYECVADEPEKVVAIDKVLEIIDAEAWSYCDWLIRERAGIGQEKVSEFADNLRERVKEL